VLSDPAGELTRRVGAWARTRLVANPWSSGVGLARTILALGTLGTLLATPSSVLLSPLVGGINPPLCSGAAVASLWCAVPRDRPDVAHWLSILVLLVVATGWRPRLTAVPHWWVSWSFVASASVQDGGDQITAVLTLLLLPLALTDPRTWHWHRAAPRNNGLNRNGALVAAYASLMLIQLQVAGLYFQASIAKLSVAEWADGTAIYYWFNSVIFGAPGYLHPLTSLISASGALVAVATWGAVALEFALALAIFFRQRVKRVLLIAGLLFHDTIALTMGLVSFDAAMTGALLLYLLPVGHDLGSRHWCRVTQRLRKLGPRVPGRPTSRAAYEASDSDSRSLPGPSATITTRRF
jgi:antimicrobial peptide system SdpB family protein